MTENSLFSDDLNCGKGWYYDIFFAKKQSDCAGTADDAQMIIFAKRINIMCFIICLWNMQHPHRRSLRCVLQIYQNMRRMRAGRKPEHIAAWVARIGFADSATAKPYLRRQPQIGEAPEKNIKCS